MQKYIFNFLNKHNQLFLSQFKKKIAQFEKFFLICFQMQNPLTVYGVHGAHGPAVASAVAGVEAKVDPVGLEWLPV